MDSAIDNPPQQYELAELSSVCGAIQSISSKAIAGAPIETDDVDLYVERLLERMLRAGLRFSMPLNQFHADGMYGREILIPAGAFAIGEIQRRPHINVISRGEISMLNQDGTFTRIRAPFTCVGVPGVRKCGYAHEDTVWTTVHNMDGFIGDPAAASDLELEDFIACRTALQWRLHQQAANLIEAHQ